MAGDDLMEMVQLYLRHNMEAVGRVIGEEERTHNPLDKGELARLKYLISKVQGAEVFTENEVEEYNALVGKLKEGKDKTDPGLAALVTVGDLLAGLKPSAADT